MTKLTELEKEVLSEIVNSDISTDGCGLQGYIIHEWFPMKQYRGVISSLMKKGVVSFEYMDPRYHVGMMPMTYGTVCDEFQERVENYDAKIHSEEEKQLIENTGYRLINIY